MNIKRIIFMILIMLTFLTIFKFSSQDGEKSKSVSIGVMRYIVEIYPKTRNISTKEKERIIKNSQPLIRKLAHYSIYLIAGIMIMGFINTFNFRSKNSIIITIIIGIVYAILDELHQGFSFGRTPRIFDVFVDTLGVLTGSIIVSIALKIKKYFGEKVNN